MALPPEHLRIKRRREEDPVETLYIQSDSVQHSKRRFTDFVFQRVVRDKDSTVVAGSSTAPTTPPGTSSKSDERGDVHVSTPAVAGAGAPTKSAVQSRAQPQLQAASHTPTHQRAVSAGFPSAVSGTARGGVPQVRATAPGEEFVRGKRAGRSQEDGKAAGNAALPKSAAAGMRRFHLAAPASDEGLMSPSTVDRTSKALGKRRGGSGGGVQKKRPAKSAKPVVVMEKTPVPAAGKMTATSTAPKGAAPGLEDITSMIDSVKVSGGTADDSKRGDGSADVAEHSISSVSSPRKRHIINEAERRWRTEEKASKYTDRMLHERDATNKARTGQSTKDDPNTWNQDSEQLADELAEIAMQMTGDAPSPTAEQPTPEAALTPQKRMPIRAYSSSPSKLTYKPRMPRTPRRRRPSRGGNGGSMSFDGASDEMDEEGAMDVDAKAAASKPQNTVPEVANKSAATTNTDSDGEYVYDEFIRRPVAEIMADPRIAHLHDLKLLGAEEDMMALPRNIGVVIITNEDAHYWDALAEDDEEGSGWDTDDEDSNAEDNPANEYPDEDLDFDDEFDDSNVAYHRYRQNASDDEEFDMDDEEDGYGYGAYNVGNSDGSY